MGVCLSKGGHPHPHPNHHHPHPGSAHLFMNDDDGFCTPEGVSSQYESPNPSGRYSFAHLDTPRVSADVGDFGVLGSLFYKRGSRSRDYGGGGGLGMGLGMLGGTGGGGGATNFISPLDMFLGGVSGRNRVHHVNQIFTGDYSFASYMASPLLKGFDVHAMEAVAKTYAESAAKAAARDAFVFLEENDHSVNCYQGGSAPAGGGSAAAGKTPKLVSATLAVETTAEAEEVAKGENADGRGDDVDDDLAKSEESEDWEEPRKSDNWDEAGGVDSRKSTSNNSNSGAATVSNTSSPSPSFRAENERATSDRWDSVLNAVQARAKARRRQRRRTGGAGGAGAGGIGRGKGSGSKDGGKGRKKIVRFRLDADDESASGGREAEGLTDDDLRSGKESDFDPGVDQEEREDRELLSDSNDGQSKGINAEHENSPLEEEDAGSDAVAPPTAATASASSAAASEADGDFYPWRDGDAQSHGRAEEIIDAEFGGFSASEVLGGLRATATEVFDGLRAGLQPFPSSFSSPSPFPSDLEAGEVPPSPAVLPGAPPPPPPSPHFERGVHVHQPSLESFSSGEYFLPEASFGSSSHEHDQEEKPNDVTTGLPPPNPGRDDDEENGEGIGNEEATSSSSPRGNDGHDDHHRRKAPEMEAGAATADAGENFTGHADRGDGSSSISSSNGRHCCRAPTDVTVFEDHHEAGGAAAAFSPLSYPWSQDVPQPQQQQDELGLLSSSFVKEILVTNDMAAGVAAVDGAGSGSGAGAGAGAGEETGMGMGAAGVGAATAAGGAPPAIPVGCVVVETRMADGSRLNPQILDPREVQLPERGEHNHGLFHPRVLSCATATPGEEEEPSEDPSSCFEQEEGGFSFPVLVLTPSSAPHHPAPRPERSQQSAASSLSSTGTSTSSSISREPPRESAWEDSSTPLLSVETRVKSRTIRLDTPFLAHSTSPPSSPLLMSTSERDIQEIESSWGSNSRSQIGDNPVPSSSSDLFLQQQQPRTSFSFDVEPSVVVIPDRTHEIVLPILPPSSSATAAATTTTTTTTTTTSTSATSSSGRSSATPVFSPSKTATTSAASSSPSLLLPALQVSSIPYPPNSRRTFNKKLKFYSLERASYAAAGAKRSKSPPPFSRESRERRRGGAGGGGGTTGAESDGESDSDLFEIETMSGTNAMGSSRTPPSTPTKGQSPPGLGGSKVPNPANQPFDFERLSDSIARVSRSRSKRKGGDNNSAIKIGSRAGGGGRAVPAAAGEQQPEAEGPAGIVLDGGGVGVTAPSTRVTSTSSTISKSCVSQSSLKGRALLKLGFLMRSGKQGGGHGRRSPHYARSNHNRDSDLCRSGETSVSEYLENKPPSPGAAAAAPPSATRYHHQTPANQHHHHHHRGGGGQCCVVEEERVPHTSHNHHQSHNHNHHHHHTYAFDWYCSSMPQKVAPLLVPQEKSLRQQQQQYQDSFTSHSRSFSNEDRTFAVKN